MGISLVKQTVSHAGAVVSGLLCGLLLLFIGVSLSYHWHGWTSRVMLLPLGMLGWMLLVWWLIGHRSFALLLGTALGVVSSVLLVVDFGQSTFADPNAFLKQCPPREIRFTYYHSQHYSGDCKLDLDTGYCVEDTTHSFHSIGVVFQTFDHEQLAKIKAVLAALPGPGWRSFLYVGNIDDQFHIAFYRGGGLCVYHYSKADIQAQLGDLFETLKMQPANFE